MRNFFRTLFLFLSPVIACHSALTDFFDQKGSVIFPDGVHYLLKNTVDGSYIELENGAQFAIIPEDQDEASTWETHSILTISPNSYLFSDGDFVLTNSQTKTHVCATYAFSPSVESPSTYFIQEIHPWSGRITLTNLANRLFFWRVDFSDSEYIQNWEVGDTVIIGYYDTWYSGLLSKSKYILITIGSENSDRVKFVRAMPDF